MTFDPAGNRWIAYTYDESSNPGTGNPAIVEYTAPITNGEQSAGVISGAVTTMNFPWSIDLSISA